MNRFLLLTLLASASLSGRQPSSADGRELPYFFTRFENDESYAPGPLDNSSPDFQLLQGTARIVRDESTPAGQWLETDAGTPYSTLFLTGDRIAANGSSYLEIWTRPFATDPDRGEEFMDFNGSVLGFFRDGDSGTLFAYHTVSASDGFWISTGITIPLDGEGAAQDWIHINISQNLLQRTWDLSVNGSAALTGINHAAAAPGKTFELWFYGHETGANRFDDVLISPLPPDALENVLKSRLPRQTTPTPKANAITAAKRVGPSESTRNRRNRNVPPPDRKKRAGVHLLDADFDIIDGAHQAGKAKDVDVDGKKTDLLIYSPSYDDEGNPLPLTLRVTCSAALTEGSDLRRIEWVLTELGKKDEPRKIISRGNFEKGLTLDVTVPGEWAKKGSSANVGINLKHKIKSTANGSFLLP